MSSRPRQRARRVVVWVLTTAVAAASLLVGAPDAGAEPRGDVGLPV